MKPLYLLPIAVVLVALAASAGCTYSDTPMTNTCVSIYSTNGTITAYDENIIEMFGPYFVWIDGEKYLMPYMDDAHRIARKSVGSKVEITYKEYCNTKGISAKTILSLSVVSPQCIACVPCCNPCTPTLTPTPCPYQPTPKPTQGCGCV